MNTYVTLSKRLGQSPIQPFCLSYGMGVDSTAMIVELARRYRAGDQFARPDVITFADTGGEMPETYAYEPVIQEFLRSVGFPALVTVRYVPKKTKNGHYTTLEQNCLVNKTLPSLAFGYKKCSLKWKRQPQDKYRASLDIIKAAWKAKQKAVVAIGYDAGPKDMRRSSIQDDAKYSYIYPLREWGWDRPRCKKEILAEGLPLPPKSACFFCPARKPDEVVDLCLDHPDLARRIVQMETNAAPNLTTIEGLWRKSTKKRPGSMSLFIIKTMNCSGC
jgi:hypothetical protein